MLPLSLLSQFLLQNLQFQRFFDPQDELHMYVKCMLLQQTFTALYDCHFGTHMVLLLFYSYALAFAIVPPLTRDINEFVKQWNPHRIRPTTYASCPGGIPDDMFQMPEHHGMPATRTNLYLIIVLLHLCCVQV